MKTAIRIIEKQFDYLNPNYRHFYLQILGKRYSTSDYLQVIGTISFQSDKNRENEIVAGEDKNIWYALSYEISTDKPENIVAMGKLSTYIKSNSSYYAQPMEIFALVGGVEYIVCEGEFLPKVWQNAMRKFKVMREEEYHSNIYAANEITAQKQLTKLIKNKTGNFTLKDEGLVQQA